MSGVKRTRGDFDESDTQLQQQVLVGSSDDCLAVSPALATFIDEHMTSFQCNAHDTAHVYRVATLAVKIAQRGPDLGSPRVAYLAGLLHDVMDSKLVVGDKTDVEEKITMMLKDNEHLTENEISDVLKIIKAVGYKNIIKPGWNPDALPKEYLCVQDADLIDAIGYIGVTRTFSFGGKRNRAIFGTSSALLGNDTVTPEHYSKGDGSGVQHFFDKLLRIKRFLRTSLGMEIAARRHKNMIDFLKGLDEELTEIGDSEAGRITELLRDYE
jgi:uncharacterized protein